MGCGDDSPVTPSGPAETVGVVSGTITNARTGRPVHGAVVELSGRQRESDAEENTPLPKWIFRTAITITVEALDYADETRVLALNTEKLTLDISLKAADQSGRRNSGIAG